MKFALLLFLFINLHASEDDGFLRPTIEEDTAPATLSHYRLFTCPTKEILGPFYEISNLNYHIVDIKVPCYIKLAAVNNLELQSDFSMAIEIKRPTKLVILFEESNITNVWRRINKIGHVVMTTNLIEVRVD